MYVYVLVGGGEEMVSRIWMGPNTIELISVPSGAFLKSRIHFKPLEKIMPNLKIRHQTMVNK